MTAMNTNLKIIETDGLYKVYTWPIGEDEGNKVLTGFILEHSLVLDEKDCNITNYAFGIRFPGDPLVPLGNYEVFQECEQAILNFMEGNAETETAEPQKISEDDPLEGQLIKSLDQLARQIADSCETYWVTDMERTLKQIELHKAMFGLLERVRKQRA